MLFLAYWELNEAMSDQERGQIGEMIISKGLFPPKGVKIIRWDGTPDGWGILLAEADNAADVFRALDVWRSAGAGFFKITKTAPALPVQDLMQLGAEITQSVASA